MLLSLLLIVFTFMELNCENMFDCQHDSMTNDTEYLPEGSRHWTWQRYYAKLNNIGREIVACGSANGKEGLPDLVALCEVENDTVMRDLTRRSLLKGAGYKYLMTHSQDRRGINVALLYSPLAFNPISSISFRPQSPYPDHPLRDILYVSGLVSSGDTLHIYILHAPSKVGKAKQTERLRSLSASYLMEKIDSLRTLSPNAKVIVSGDFNDYENGKTLQLLQQNGLLLASQGATGENGAKGTYRYLGKWGSLDHILTSVPLRSAIKSCRISAPWFVLEEDRKYGGLKPKRTFIGLRYNNGFSDHLPLVMQLEW